MNKEMLEEIREKISLDMLDHIETEPDDPEDPSVKTTNYLVRIYGSDSLPVEDITDAMLKEYLNMMRMHYGNLEAGGWIYSYSLLRRTGDLAVIQERITWDI